MMLESRIKPTEKIRSEKEKSIVKTNNSLMLSSRRPVLGMNHQLVQTLHCLLGAL